MRVTRDAVTLPDGRQAERFVLDAGGIRVTLASLGATLLAIEAPDRAGTMANVILGDADPARYPAGGADAPDAYLGATCGRVANRIRDARFALDGVMHRLAANEGRHQLHGGPDGFHRRIWRATRLARGVRMRLVSGDGDQGYPGALSATATFALLDPHTLLIAYRARTDRPTHVNLVTHPYFNLAGDGEGAIDDHVLGIAAQRFLPIDAEALPTGAEVEVAATPFDYREPRQIDAARAYNHCLLIDGPPGRVRPAATLHDPVSGRTLHLATDQPGLHFYSGDWIDGGLATRPGRPRFGARSGLCLEAEGLPDAANLPHLRSTRLDPGGVYRSRTLLRFG
ncbi:aldose epimerase family protein [Sphingomonas baiyangensis]|uniref:Aldose 1-epimerase n=1 Tax=Sphingomonas baiyangensis TaxID=2572576 RepID=A0A4U1L4I7_9SPHN|nr:aldose epimerase family protein [Sphingomonas baiyangensis]TKD51837.1 galactose mutarotase [Sphingomonas baiyangensis]